MTRFLGLAWVVALSTAFSSGVATASLIAYDPFLSGSNLAAGEYVAATNIGAATQGAFALGWAGTVGGPDGLNVPHVGNTSNFQANAVGENSTAVTYEAGGRLNWLGVGGNPFTRFQNRQLSTAAASTSSSEWWFSIMVNRLNWTTAQNTFVTGGFVDASLNGLSIGYDNSGLAGGVTVGTPDLVLRAAGVNHILTPDVPANDNQFVVVQLLTNTAPMSPDTVNVWIDPPSQPLGSPSVTFTTINVTDSLTPFIQSRYVSTGPAGAAFFDEIRLATTSDGLGVLIPEPTSLVAAGIAFAGLFCLRRRGC